MSEVVVSILTPSLNQGRWLEDNLRSVASQTYAHVEHIVMDGGSSDGSIEILERAAHSVRWRSEPDDGQSSAINKAFRESTGEVIGWINSDDAYVDRRAVARVVEVFEQHPRVDVVYGDVVLVDDESFVMQYYRIPDSGPSWVRYGDPLMQPGVFVRRRAVSDPLTREDLRFCMDRALWLRLAFEGRKFYRLREPVAIDRYQPGRKGEVLRDALLQEHARLAGEFGLVDGRVAHLRGRLSRIRQRAMGVMPLLQFERRIDPAIPLRLDGRAPRALRQLAVPRRRMKRYMGTVRPLGSG